jgi:predicted signal transduction protein with EAL and GGDEF domain
MPTRKSPPILHAYHLGYSLRLDDQQAAAAVLTVLCNGLARLGLSSVLTTVNLLDARLGNDELAFLLPAFCDDNNNTSNSNITSLQIGASIKEDTIIFKDRGVAR